MSFEVDATLAHQLVKEVRAITHLPLLVKLSPNDLGLTQSGINTPTNFVE